MRLYTSELVKSYKSRTVVNHVTIDVNQGEIVGLLGPNGAGKTTTFYMIVGLIKPNEGRIYLENDEGIVTDACLAKALGFSGKASISPRHVEVINQVFSPTQQEIDYAYEVLDAIALAAEQGKGAIALHGKMIDAPIVARAQRTIAVAQALGMERGN